MISEFAGPNNKEQTPTRFGLESTGSGSFEVCTPNSRQTAMEHFFEKEFALLMNTYSVINVVDMQIKPAHSGVEIPDGVSNEIKAFLLHFSILESVNATDLYVFKDFKNDALFTECHLSADQLLSKATTEASLDPQNQPEYRANREVVTDDPAFLQMKEDAQQGRVFSNLVAEFDTSYDADHPLKIIGGQHRFQAIAGAIPAQKDKYHGVKVYFGLTSEQRLDVQLISNTNIEISADLLDRMQETLRGPELRSWCQKVGLLPAKTDFSDRRAKDKPISVRLARSFIVNFVKGKAVSSDAFEKCDTTPYLCKTGVEVDEEYQKVCAPSLWTDHQLERAGKEYARLILSHKTAIAKKKELAKVTDYSQKAVSLSVISAWAFVAGHLQSNTVRLDRHYALADQKPDPLNVAILAKGRHKTDPENYRGLGVRADAKERGRMVEVFYLQAEKGEGVNAGIVDVAIKRYHAKVTLLDAKKAEEKLK
jgi:hypothetical protein